MFIVYDTDTGEELYKVNTVDEKNFKNTTEEYTEKIINGQLIKETKVRNISYRKE